MTRLLIALLLGALLAVGIMSQGVALAGPGDHAWIEGPHGVWG